MSKRLSTKAFTILTLLAIAIAMFILFCTGCAPTNTGMTIQEIDAWHKSMIIPDAEIMPTIRRIEVEKRARAISAALAKYERWMQ